MPQKQRLRVWNGDLKKTSGGLTKAMLFKNKRGKIVSRKKSGQASGANNLGKWLRKSGDAFGDRPKGAPDPKAKEKKSPSVAAAKTVKVVAKAKAKPKPHPPKPKPKPPKRKRAEPMKPGEKKDLTKVSVGNIVVPKENKKEEWESWPNRIRRMIRNADENKGMIKEIKELREEGESWDDVLDYFKGGSFPTGLRKKVKKRLKATRRGKKRRTKKTLLQDVLD